MTNAEIVQQGLSLASRLLPGVDLWGWRVALLDFLFLAADVLLFGAFLIFSLRVYKRDPIKGYPFRVALLSLVPFCARWQKEVAAEHICLINKSRTVFFSFFIAAFVVAILRILYGRFLFEQLHTLH